MMYRREALDEMDHRKLDAVVHRVVFGEQDIPDDLPQWSTTWPSLGTIIDYMTGMGFAYDVDGTSPELGIDVTFWPPGSYGKPKLTATASTFPRAVATAAIIAIQSGKLVG